MARFYDWDATFSRQVGTNGEICIVCGGKDIGKTFGLRLKCIERFIKKQKTFVELCRTKEESQKVANGYFSKLQAEGFFTEYVFKTESNCGYIARKPIDEDETPDWQLLMYFVSLTAFQQEKKRTYVKPARFIFDEAFIDTKDRYHRYLPDEFLILANLLDTVSRQQPNDDYQYRVYLLGNAVDLTCPYMRFNGINKLPKDFGYYWFKNKTVLFHYVEPWDAEDRKAYTLVGRMLAGNDEAKVIFDNRFEGTNDKTISKKSSAAKYAFAIKWQKVTFAIWIDYGKGYYYVTQKLPAQPTNIYTLVKQDATPNYPLIEKTSGLMQLLLDVFKLGGLRYDSPWIRETFFEILTFLGVK